MQREPRRWRGIQDPRGRVRFVIFNCCKVRYIYRPVQLYAARRGVLEEEDGLEHHLDLMSSIGVHGCSSDESDYNQNPVIFLKVTPKWRSIDLEMFLDRLDGIIEARKMANIGRRRRPRGRLGRQRCFSDKVNELAIAPQNLPFNCYNPEWLRGLSPYQMRLLAIEKEHSYDFSMPHDFDVQPEDVDQTHSQTQEDV